MRIINNNSARGRWCSRGDLDIASSIKYYLPLPFSSPLAFLSFGYAILPNNIPSDTVGGTRG